MVMNKRTHIVIPEQLAEEIDTLVGTRGRSSFLTEAAWKEVRRLRILKALDEASASACCVERVSRPKSRPAAAAAPTVPIVAVQCQPRW